MALSAFSFFHRKCLHSRSRIRVSFIRSGSGFVLQTGNFSLQPPKGERSYLQELLDQDEPTYLSSTLSKESLSYPSVFQSQNKEKLCTRAACPFVVGHNLMDFLALLCCFLKFVQKPNWSSWADKWGALQTWIKFLLTQTVGWKIGEREGNVLIALIVLLGMGEEVKSTGFPYLWKHSEGRQLLYHKQCTPHRWVFMSLLRPRPVLLTVTIRRSEKLVGNLLFLFCCCCCCCCFVGFQKLLDWHWECALERSMEEGWSGKHRLQDQVVC